MRRKATLIIILLSFVTATCGIFLVSNFVSADDSIIDDVAISVPISCTMLGTGTNTHNAEIPNGTYRADIGTTTLKIYCNDSAGFSIYAIGFTGEQYSGNNTKLIGVNNNQMISTGTATSGSTSNWAMKLATNSGATYPITLQNGFGAYSAVPATYTKVATSPNATDIGTGATGAELTTTYASYMSSDQIADTYSGKVKYTLVHPASSEPREQQTCDSGKICYFPNTYSYEGTMGTQYVSTSSTKAILNTSNYKREGYGFAGWSTSYDLTGDFYGPNETIFFSAGEYTGNNPGLALYAIWVESQGSLQDSAKVATICTNLTEATPNGTKSLSNVSALTDNRDNQTYAIAKLADGNCWMIENLRLDNTAELTTSNTNSPLNDGTNVTIKHNYTDTITHNTISASSSVAYDENTAPDGWCSPRNATCYDQSRFRTGSPYSNGNYYNWYSATAGRGTYSLNSGITVVGDLCPSGWRLPVGGDNNNSEFKTLNALYNNGSMDVNNKLRAYPLNFLYTRSVGEDGSISSSTDYAYYWTATSYSNQEAYFMILSSNQVNPGNNHTYKNRGSTIRCLAITQ